MKDLECVAPSGRKNSCESFHTDRILFFLTTLQSDDSSMRITENPLNSAKRTKPGKSILVQKTSSFAHPPFMPTFYILSTSFFPAPSASLYRLSLLNLPTHLGDEPLYFLHSI
jgi:hypothetical protein